MSPLPELAPGEIRRSWIDLSPSLVGAFRLPMVRIRGKRPGPRISMIAAQHGDEGFGILGVLDLLEQLDPEELKGELSCVPCANLAAYVDGHHHSPFDHQDMNRVHPGNAAGTMTEQISAAIFEMLVPECDLFIDVHGGSVELGNIPYLRYTDVTGKPSVRPIAEGIGIRDLASPNDRKIPGMLSLALLEAGVPGLSIEVGSAFVHPHAGGLEMAEYLRRMLGLAGALDGVRPERGERVYSRLAGCRSRVSGAYEPLVDLGDRVEKDQLLGRVRDLIGNTIQEARAPETGVIGVMKTSVRVHPGESLVWVLAPVETPTV